MIWADFIQKKKTEFESNASGKYSDLSVDDKVILRQVDELIFLASDRQVHLRSYFGLSLWS